MQPAEKSLIEVLDEQIECARAMLGTLDNESRALVAGDTEGLNAASADKARLVESLEGLEQERRALAAALGIDGGAKRSDDAGRRWRRLLELLEACRDGNLRNGGLVAQRRGQVTAALKLLRGAQSELYDAHGREASSRGMERLGSA